MTKSYVEYWKEKEESARIWSMATKVHTVATWHCGCQLGYSAVGYSPLTRCETHSVLRDPRWFGLPNRRRNNANATRCSSRSF